MAFPHDGNKFQDGQSGNLNGRPKGSVSIRGALKQLLEKGVKLTIQLPGGKSFEKVITNIEIATEALKNIYSKNPIVRQRAIEWLTEQTDGKVMQSIELESKEMVLNIITIDEEAAETMKNLRKVHKSLPG